MRPAFMMTIIAPLGGRGEPAPGLTLPNSCNLALRTPAGCAD
jgi:hypothetical protein